MPGGLHQIDPVTPILPHYLQSPLIPIHEVVQSSHKTPQCVCTNYLLTESIPIIYHPICKQISAYFFIKSTFFLKGNTKNIIWHQCYTNPLPVCCISCHTSQESPPMNTNLLKGSPTYTYPYFCISIRVTDPLTQPQALTSFIRLERHESRVAQSHILADSCSSYQVYSFHNLAGLPHTTSSEILYLSPVSKQVLETSRHSRERAAEL